jgi:gliding motility-associated-like protein
MLQINNENGMKMYWAYYLALKNKVKLSIMILFFLFSSQTYSQCNLLCNTDFENNQITTSLIIFDAINVPCWGTTAADNQIEVWTSGSLGVPSYSGNQFVELNANVVSTLYQNFTTLPGTSLSISFAHRGRSGVDVMSVSIGPVGGPYTTLGTFSDGNTAWGYYTASYLVPVGLGNNYSLRFNSVSAAGGNQSIGNFLDAININLPQNIIPTFAPVSDICSGSFLGNLPTTSNNGIIGTWSPAINNTTTTNYTFTPTAGQCATTTNLTISVNPNITPIFTPISAICLGSSLNTLPTTSNNGITGIWSPTINNTATTNYTFTPTAGQCATTTNLTISVNPIITPTFNAISAICSGSSLNTLPTTSNNGIIGTWSPAINNTATTNYTFTPNTGQCASTTNLTISVNPNITPTFTPVSAICSGENINTLPTTSNNGITGTWSPVINNTTTTNYTYTPTAGQCATTTILTISVNPNITPIFTPVSPICSGETLNALPTTSIEGITGTWSPSLNNTATSTYTFTPSAGQCATTTNLTINVRDGFTTFYAPNAFTPDGNGLNDNFIPICYGNENYNLKIFNRWGELIFETDDISIGWDGRNKGNLIEDGTYLWIISYRSICRDKKNIKKIGHVTLLK